MLRHCKFAAAAADDAVSDDDAVPDDEVDDVNDAVPEAVTDDTVPDATDDVASCYRLATDVGCCY